jgi:UDP-2,3-diacylglucosamine pyrophosphatase LpxH
MGNHDEFLRPFLPLILGDSIHLVNEAEYKTLDDRLFHITHGDFFDSVTMTKKWLAVLGDIGYSTLLYLNAPLNRIRQIFGIKRYWSLSKYIKDNVKSSVSFINDFEKILSNYAKKNNYDGVICGHIHKAEIKQIDGIMYLNSGDWVESCTALVETLEGNWEIIEVNREDEEGEDEGEGEGDQR